MTEPAAETPDTPPAIPPETAGAGTRRRPAVSPAVVAFVAALVLRGVGLASAPPVSGPEQALLDSATPEASEAPGIPGAATVVLRVLRAVAPAPSPPPGVVEGLPPLPDPALRLARVLAALLGALAAALAASAATALGGRRAGLVAGLLLGLAAVPIGLSTSWGRGALLLAAAAGCAAALAARAAGRPGATVGVGAWTGLAAASGGGGGAALILGAPAAGVRGRGLAFAALVGLAVLSLAAPSFVTGFPALPDTALDPTPARSPLAAALRELARAAGWPALILALLGAWRVLRRGDRAGLAILAATGGALIATLLRMGPSVASLAVVLPGAAVFAGLGAGAPRGGRDLVVPAAAARLVAVACIAWVCAGTAAWLGARFATPPAAKAAEWIRRNLPNGEPFLLEDRGVLVATPRGLRTLTDLADAGRAPRALLDDYARGSKTFRPVPLPSPDATGAEAALFYDPNLALFFPWMVLRDPPPVNATPEVVGRVAGVFHEYFRDAWTVAARFPAVPGRGPGLVVLHRPDSTKTIDRERLAVLGPLLAGSAMSAVRDTSTAFTAWLREGGEALMSGAQTVGSLGFLELAASRDSSSAEVFYRLAQAYLLRGRAEDAKSASLTGLGIDPFHGGIHYNLAVSLEAEGDLDGAEVEYRAAIQNMPEPSVAHARLGGVLLARGDVAGAREELATVRRLAPGEEADRYLSAVLGADP